MKLLKTETLGGEGELDLNSEACQLLTEEDVQLFIIATLKYILKTVTKSFKFELLTPKFHLC